MIERYKGQEIQYSLSEGFQDAHIAQPIINGKPLIVDHDKLGLAKTETEAINGARRIAKIHILQDHIADKQDILKMLEESPEYGVESTDYRIVLNELEELETELEEINQNL